jgi:stage V sporulation protein AC
MTKAFLIGGLICVVGQLFLNLFKSNGLDNETAAAATSITMVFSVLS